MSLRQFRTIRQALRWLVRASIRSAIRQETIMSDLTRLNAAIASLEGMVANAANADQPAIDAAAQGIEDFVAANTPPAA